MAQIPKSRLVKGPKFNQYVGTVPFIFSSTVAIFGGKRLIGGDLGLQLDVISKGKVARSNSLNNWTYTSLLGRSLYWDLEIFLYPKKSAPR